MSVLLFSIASFLSKEKTKKYPAVGLSDMEWSNKFAKANFLLAFCSYG